MNLLRTLIMFIAISVYVQTDTSAYICENSCALTNARNAPNGNVAQNLLL